MVDLTVGCRLKKELVFQTHATLALRLVKIDQRFVESVASLRKRVRNTRAERLRLTEKREREYEKNGRARGNVVGVLKTAAMSQGRKNARKLGLKSGPNELLSI